MVGHKTHNQNKKKIHNDNNLLHVALGASGQGLRDDYIITYLSMS